VMPFSVPYLATASIPMIDARIGIIAANTPAIRKAGISRFSVQAELE